MENVRKSDLGFIKQFTTAPMKCVSQFVALQPLNSRSVMKRPHITLPYVNKERNDKTDKSSIF
jgi:hypothetical protein